MIPVAAVPLEVGADQSEWAQSPEGEGVAQTELAAQRQQRWGPLLAVAVSQPEEGEVNLNRRRSRYNIVLHNLI